MSALRANKELQEWYDSLSEDEKQAEKTGHCYQYSTDTDEIYFDTATFKLPDSEDEELPFQ